MNISQSLQEAQAALLAKDDELTTLQHEVRHAKAQAKRAQDSASQASPAQHATVVDQAQPSKPAGNESSNNESSKTESSRAKPGQGNWESGLPSPSLPATPKSQGGSPSGTLLYTHGRCTFVHTWAVHCSHHGWSCTERENKEDTFLH